MSGDCEVWIDGDLVFGAFAAAGAAFAFILYQELTMMRRRKRKKRSDTWQDFIALGKFRSFRITLDNFK